MFIIFLAMFPPPVLSLVGKTLYRSFAFGNGFIAMCYHRGMSASPATVARAPRGGDLFGHPRGLTFLFATEMWERFSYYGMRALLVLYMVKYLLDPQRAGQVVGLGAFRSALEFVFGPLDVQPLASQIYGFYTGLVYLTPILGGFLADRVLGQKTAEDRREINQPSVEAVDLRGERLDVEWAEHEFQRAAKRAKADHLPGALRVEQIFNHVEDEQRAHPVI